MTQDATLALLQIGGAPGDVNVIQGSQAGLNVPAGSHLLGTADQHRHLAADALIAQQAHLVGLARFVHEPDLLRRHAPGDQLLLDGRVDGELSGILGRGAAVAERHL